MHGRSDPTDERAAALGHRGRHRAARSGPAPVVAGLAVAALLATFGVGTALLPPDLIGLGAAGPTATGAGADGSDPDAAAGWDATGSGAPADTAPGLVADRAAAAARQPAATPPGARPPGATPARPSSSPPGDKAARKKPPAARPSPPANGRTGGQKSGPDPRRDTPPPAPAGDFEAMETEVVDLTNARRRSNGCTDLTVNPSLRTAMRLHVQEVARHDGLYLSHVSDDGRTFVQRARAQGYPDPGAENIARGQRTAREVVDGWMNSEGHRRNIVNCDLQAIGVGVATGDGTLVWGQLFGFS